MFEARLEDVAQLTEEITYDEAWKLNAKATADKNFRKKVRAALENFDDAVAEDDEDGMAAAGKELKALVEELDAYHSVRIDENTEILVPGKE